MCETVIIFNTAISAFLLIYKFHINLLIIEEHKGNSFSVCDFQSIVRFLLYITCNTQVQRLMTQNPKRKRKAKTSRVHVSNIWGVGVVGTSAVATAVFRVGYKTA